MLQSILELFITEQKAEAILANPMIEFIFFLLILGFMIAVLLHLIIFSKLKKLQNYLIDTNRMDVEPLQSISQEFDKRQQMDEVKVETFVQEKFSGWRVLGFPIVNLIKVVQMTVSVFILIGVLGTFIGLTMSLSGINGTGDQIVENVASVLSGIDVAFYTSIAGMGFSLVMTILVKVLNTEQMLTSIMLKVESMLDRKEENGLGRLINVSETIHQSIVDLKDSNQKSLNNMEQAFEGFQEYTIGLQQSAKDLAVFNVGLTNNLKEFQELFQQMKEVTNGFTEGTARMNENFETLFSYFKNMEDNNNRMTEAFENTYEKIKTVSELQADTWKHFLETVEDLKGFTSSLLKEQKMVQDSIGKISNQSNQLVKKMEQQNREFKQIFGTDLSSKLAKISTYLGELRSDFDRLGESITSLPEALEVINQTQIDHRDLLTDRFDELKQFNQQFGNHLKSHASDSMAFEKHMREAATTYEQLGHKNSQLIQEMNRTITQMNHAFSHQESQIESSVSMVKDTLTQYASGIENTLGSRLDQVVRNISDSLNKNNDHLQRQLMDLQRVSEEVQQNNVRYTQQMLQELNREIQTFNRQLNVVSQQGIQRQNSIGLNQNGY